MGPGKYESVVKSQSVLIMLDPMITPRTRTRCIWRLAAPPRPWRARLTMAAVIPEPHVVVIGREVSIFCPGVSMLNFVTRTGVT
jgi:hypothetical protein